MFVVWAIALLCFLPASHSAPLDCNDLLKPLDQPDLHHLEGKWTMVADSLEITESLDPVKPVDSLSITFFNSTYTKAARYGNMCYYETHNVLIDGHNFKVEVPFNYGGTFHHTSCADCVMLSLSLDSPEHKSKELCLFSKRREVDPEELREFITQVECQNMPKPFVMDPTKGLCPAFTGRFSN